MLNKFKYNEDRINTENIQKVDDVKILIDENKSTYRELIDQVEAKANTKLRALKNHK